MFLINTAVYCAGLVMKNRRIIAKCDFAKVDKTSKVSVFAVSIEQFICFKRADIVFVE